MTQEQRAEIITHIWILSGVVGREDITWESLAEWTDDMVREAGDAIYANPRLMQLLGLAQTEPEGSA